MKVLSFNEAVEYYRDKIPMTPEEYAALVEEIGDYAATQAFTVARIASADLLQDLHAEILKAIEKGSTFYEFREGIDALMGRMGWEGLSPYRLDNIFRTNVQSAYNHGRYKQQIAIANRRPYWEYDAVNDSYTRPTHAAQDGKIYHYLHPFWNAWYPPNGYRCRCRVNSLSEAEMKEEGLKEETAGTDLKPDEGFSFNPGKENWKPEKIDYNPELVKEMEQEVFK